LGARRGFGSDSGQSHVQSSDGFANAAVLRSEIPAQGISTTPIEIDMGGKTAWGERQQAPEVLGSRNHSILSPTHRPSFGNVGGSGSGAAIPNEDE